MKPLRKPAKAALVYVGAGLFAAALALLLATTIHFQLDHPAVRQWDLAVQAWVHLRTAAALAPVLKALTLLGKPAAEYPLCALVFALLWRVGRRGDAWLLAGTMLGAELLLDLLKLHFKRPRPAVPWRWEHEHGYSFPSGHALMSVVLYATLVYLVLPRLRPAALRAAGGVVAVTIVLGTGYSRIFLGAHWPTDVATGFLCGTVWVASLLSADRLVRRAQ